MPINSLGISATSSSLQGPQGNPGRGILSIDSVDNHDGSVSFTFNFTDGLSEGPFTASILSDSLSGINQMIISGTNLSNKFEVQDSSNSSIFTVDSLVRVISMLGKVQIDTNDSSAFSVKSGTNTVLNVSTSGSNIIMTGTLVNKIGSSQAFQVMDPSNNILMSLLGTGYTVFKGDTEISGVSSSSKFSIGSNSLINIFKVDTSTPRVDINTPNFYINGSLYSSGTSGGTFTDAITISKSVSGTQFNAITVSNTAATASSLAGIVFNYRNASNVAKSETLFVSDDEYICTSGNFAVMGPNVYCQGALDVGGAVYLLSTLTSSSSASFLNECSASSFLPKTAGSGSIGGVSGYFAGSYITTMYSTNHYLQKSGVGNLLLRNNYGASTIPALEISNPALSSACVVNIVPGYKGGTQTDGWATYDIPGGGTHYFWDGIEVSGDLTVDGTLYAGNITPPSTSSYNLGSPSSYFLSAYLIQLFCNNIYCNNVLPSTNNIYNLGSSSYYFNTGYITTLNSGNINCNNIIPNANVSYGLGSGSRYFASAYINTINATTTNSGNINSTSAMSVTGSNGAALITQLNLTNSAAMNGSGVKITLNGYGSGASRVATISFDGTSIQLTNNGSSGWFGPNGASMTLGNATNYFTSVYSNGGIILTSDVNSKNSIQDQTLGLEFIGQLRPVTYKLNVKSTENTYDEEGNILTTTPVPGVRRHHGLIAQEVKAVLDNNGLTSDDFAGWCEEDGKQMLRYEEFISPMIKAIQELSATVAELKTQNQSMQQQINEILGH